MKTSVKIAVSTIAKNEADNVKDFVESCKEADIVSILDTGSTDDTVKLLKKYKAFAGEAKIEPWDFAKARNRALDLLPEDVDIVVSIDMDERLKPGWREALLNAWQDDTESASYRYISEWQDEKQTIPGVVVWRSKVFKRKGFKWFNPVHEIPLPEEGRWPNLIFCEGMVVEHYQKGERDYSGLLTKWLEDSPNYKDGYIQRGADYLKTERYKKAIDDFEKYIELTRNDQKNCAYPNCQRCQLTAGRRARCYLDIARAKHKLGHAPYEIIKLFLKAVAEAPDLREAWTYLADGWMSVGNYPAAYGAAMTALQITNPGIHSQEMICWGVYPKDIADLAFSKLVKGTEGETPGQMLSRLESAKESEIIKQEVGGKTYNLRTNTIDRLILCEVVIFQEYSRYLHLTKDDIFLDVGGHIGTFSIDISDKVNKVFVFEPEPDNYALLDKNIKENKIDNITAFNEAVVGNNDKEREFHLDETRDTGGHSLLTAEGKKKIKVRCQNINDILKSYKINKVKMDCEGSEYEIIKVMDLKNIQEMILEFHFYLLGSAKFEELTALLKKSFNDVQIDKASDPYGRLIKIYCNK